jgi:hypothetical protein
MPMLFFMEKIDPPLRPVPFLTDNEKLRAEATKIDDRWVKNLIEHLGGVFRSM